MTNCFYAAIGIFDEKLPLGGVDSDIIEYVKNSAGIAGRALERTNLLITQLQALSKDETWNFSSGINKRFVKFLCMLCGYGYVDFSKNSQRKVTTTVCCKQKIVCF